MTAFVLTNVAVLIDEHDFTADTLSVDTTAESNMVRCTNMASGGFEQFTPGLAQSSVMSLAAYVDYATADDVGRQLSSADLGTSKVMTVLPIGSATAGNPAIFHQGWLQSLQVPTGAVGDAAMLSASTSAQGAYVIGGQVAAPLAARTGNFTGAVLPYTGPAAGQRLYAALHVIAATGTNLAVTLQSDDGVGFGSPTGRITFSTTSAVGVQYASVAGPFATETHFRVSVTATGAFTYAVVFGVS